MPFLTTANSNHQLHYADTHPSGALPTPKSQTLIFIHGLGSSQNFYYPLFPFLQDKHRCVALDTYGSGRSPYTGDAVSIHSVAADVIGAMDALNIGKAVVVGHSMGGLVVTELGATMKERIAGVIAIGPTHPNEGMVGVMNKRADTVSEAGMEPMANTIPNQATGSGATPLQRAFIRELLLSQNPKGYAALCRAIASATPSNYAAINGPFMLVAGDEDKSATMEGCHHIANLVNSHNKRMEVLARVGHWHCVEAPEQMGKLMSVFMMQAYGV